MLDFLRPSASDRKLRLFICACVRRVWGRLRPASREGVEIAERFADGLASWPEVEQATGAAWGLGPNAAWAVSEGKETSPFDRVRYLTGYIPVHYGGLPEEAPAQADLLRDIFGNPFRRVRGDPSWLSHNDQAVAR